MEHYIASLPRVYKLSIIFILVFFLISFIPSIVLAGTITFYSAYTINTSVGGFDDDSNEMIYMGYNSGNDTEYFWSLNSDGTGTHITECYVSSDGTLSHGTKHTIGGKFAQLRAFKFNSSSIDIFAQNSPDLRFFNIWHKTSTSQIEYYNYTLLASEAFINFDVTRVQIDNNLDSYFGDYDRSRYAICWPTGAGGTYTKIIQFKSWHNGIRTYLNYSSDIQMNTNSNDLVQIVPYFYFDYSNHNRLMFINSTGSGYTLKTPCFQLLSYDFDAKTLTKLGSPEVISSYNNYGVLNVEPLDFRNYGVASKYAVLINNPTNLSVYASYLYIDDEGNLQTGNNIKYMSTSTVSWSDDHQARLISATSTEFYSTVQRETVTDTFHCYINDKNVSVVDNGYFGYAWYGIDIDWCEHFGNLVITSENWDKLTIKFKMSDALVPDPSADFIASNTHPLIGENVTFTDLSTGYISNWSWDLNGDSVIDSYAQNPIFNYSSLGSYDVTLHTMGFVGKYSNLTKNDYIIVGEEVIPPNPDDENVWSLVSEDLFMGIIWLFIIMFLPITMNQFMPKYGFFLGLGLMIVPLGLGLAGTGFLIVTFTGLMGMLLFWWKGEL